MGKIRGTNSSPGFYTQITDLEYASKSLGITTLGLVGETLKGPAFEPIAIRSWEEFVAFFGGTSTETWSSSKKPKYELPYIAKSYLSASDQLYVCRVLGDGFRPAYTPWVVGGTGNTSIFRFITVSDGDASNSDIKISIANIDDTRKTFDVYVRDFNDDDKNPTFLESFRGLSLVEGGDNFIGYKIGTLDGEYEQKSRYIIVDMANNVSKDTIPCGFQKYPSGINVDYVSNASGKTYYGVEVSGVTESTFDYKANAVTDNDGLIENTDFFTFTLGDKSKNKFTFYPACGYDGKWGNSETSGRTSIGIANGITGGVNELYTKALEFFENPDYLPINLLAVPGIYLCSEHKDMVNYIIDLVEDRKDCFYVVATNEDGTGNEDNANVLTEVTDYNTYCAATYYPWVRFLDKSKNRYINLSVIKDVVRNMANVDNKKYPWYAPAGIERGNVECAKACFYTKLAEENKLYDVNINPVKTFSFDGVKIWGNKTLYNKNTPMNRINSVRLVLYMRKLIGQAVLSLIFEPNDVTLKSQFEGIVSPILDQIKSDRGITDYRLKVSQTPEQMDAHEMSAQLFIKPTPALEYIELEFVVTPQGVEWDD